MKTQFSLAPRLYAASVPACLALVLLWAAPPLAAESALSDGFTAAITDRDELADMEAQLDDLRMVGEARLKVLLWSVYDSRLYTQDGTYEEGQRPLRLEIQYLLDIKKDALIQRTLEEWEAMGRSHPNQDDWLASLSEMWTDIREDDVLTFELDSASAATFRRNGERLGMIEDPAFGQQFIDIWLSSDCTRPELRLTLLGLDG
ncbi:MAG: chalcone isomerase family protein [Pseudomonadota bacterium]